MSLLSKLNEKNAEISDSPAHQRLAMLFDEGAFTQLDTFGRSENGPVEVVAGFGTVEGSPVYAFAQDGTIAGGAVSRAAAMKIKKVYDLASKTGAPIVAVYDSKGARLAEGVDVLSAYGEMLLFSNNISGVVPQIAVVAGTCGGTAAMLAASADIVIMSEKAELFIGADGDRNAQAAAKAGVTHITAADDKEAMLAARSVISKLPLNNLSAAPISEFDEVDGCAENFRTVSENITGADTAALVACVADAGSITELQKDFGTAVYTALAGVGGTTAGIVAFNGQVIDHKSAVKAARFVQFCDAYALPVITLVNTPGFQTDGCACMIREAAKLSHAYAEATTPKIALITGKAIGAAYIALAGRAANADMVFAWPNAEIASLPEDAAVTILYHDRLAKNEKRADLTAEYRENVSSAFAAAASGGVDDVIDPADTRVKLISAMDMLAGKRVSRMPKKHSNMPL